MKRNRRNGESDSAVGIRTVLLDLNGGEEHEPEPLATRVALHPFLAGMNQTQLALLTDSAMAAQFKIGEVLLRQGELTGTKCNE